MFSFLKTKKEPIQVIDEYRVIINKINATVSALSDASHLLSRLRNNKSYPEDAEDYKKYKKASEEFLLVLGFDKQQYEEKNKSIKKTTPSKKVQSKQTAPRV